ncbi:MAG: hypothetical protein KJP25_04360 [Gammaproteobacteria bacterium]|nr:hypothetical protein [Gammaproteobacteria bacterium]NND39828.1 hypothetical protein [Pseudomonadales bacterium]MBT8150982.1 hypothetical protein [Gammaproteobacteria bacterium]NNL11331.1 hypothetical protein [Pseudomonadales bacterium]NNM11166.1 hypothetical protein [Pseudomonadales bacterium]
MFPTQHPFKFAASAIAILCFGLVVSALFSSRVAAEGGRAGADTDINQRGWLEFWSESMNKRYPRHDENFIAGKQIYLGQSGDARIRFCLAADEQAPRIPLSRKSLRPYRSMPVTAFVKVLYDCDDAKTHALQKLSPEEAGLVVYYLNRQYKLRLKQPGRGGGDRSRRR